MAGGNLKIQVLLSAVNRLTEPLRSAAGQARILSGAIGENRQRIAALNQTQARINGFRETVQQVRASGRALSQAQAKVRELAAQMNAAGGGTAKMRKQMERANRAVTQASAQLDRHRTAAQQMRNALREAGIDTQRLGQHEQRLRSDLAGATAEIERQRRRLEQLEQQQQRVNAAGQRYQGLMSARNNMASAGMGMTMAGGGVLMAAKKVMAPGYDFEATMSRVQALTRLSKTSGEMEAMTQQARDLGAATMFSATEAAEGQAFLAMAGFTPDAILKSMPGMLDLAKAGGLEIGRAADISSNILTGFKLQASDMGAVGDILTGAFTRSNVTMEMLAETMKYTAPVAAGLGVDLQTAAAMAGKLGDAGIQGGMAGTAMAAIMTRMAAPPKMAADAMATLGLKTRDAKGNLRAMPDILAEIARKTAKMGDAQRAEIFKGLAGQEAIKAMFTLVDKAGSGELQEFITTLRASGGEVAVVAKVMGDNMMGTFDELTSAWEDLGIELYDVNKGALRELTTSVTEIVNDFGKWARENKELVSALSKIVLVGAAVVALLGGLALVMAAIIGPFAMLQYGAAMLGIKILPLLGGAFKAVAAAVRIASMAMMANPFGLIAIAILAVGAAAYLIWDNWDWVWGKILGIVDRVKTAWAGGLGGMMQLLADWKPGQPVPVGLPGDCGRGDGVFRHQFAVHFVRIIRDVSDAGVGQRNHRRAGLCQGRHHRRGRVRHRLVQREIGHPFAIRGVRGPWRLYHAGAGAGIVAKCGAAVAGGQ